MTDLYQLRPLEWKETRLSNSVQYTAETPWGDYVFHDMLIGGVTCIYAPTESVSVSLAATSPYFAKLVASDHYKSLISKALLPASPASIVARYEELKQEGLIVTGQGSATVNIEAKENDNVPTQ